MLGYERSHDNLNTSCLATALGIGIKYVGIKCYLLSLNIILIIMHDYLDPFLYIKCKQA